MPPGRCRPLAHVPLPEGVGGPYVLTEHLWDAWAFAAVESELALSAWKQAAHGLKEAALATRIAPKVGERLQTRWAFGKSAA